MSDFVAVAAFGERALLPVLKTFVPALGPLPSIKVTVVGISELISLSNCFCPVGVLCKSVPILLSSSVANSV